MKLSIVTPKGMVFDGDVDFITVEGDQGQLGILPNHVPVVVSIKDGFVKRIVNNQEVYNVISGGLLEFSNNLATVIAQETVEGTSLEEAKNKLNQIRKQQLQMNQKRVIDFAEMEKELALNLKEIKASQI